MVKHILSASYGDFGQKSVSVRNRQRVIYTYILKITNGVCSPAVGPLVTIRIFLTDTCPNYPNQIDTKDRFYLRKMLI